MRTLVWFRGKDLRVSDHAPLHEAIQSGEVITVFVLDPYFFSSTAAAHLPHRMQFLLDSLQSLSMNLRDKGGELLLATGKSIDVIPDLAKKFQVDQVSAYRWTEPFGQKRDAIIKTRLSVPLRLFDGETLCPPGSVRTKANTPYSVYTPFAQAARAFLGTLTCVPTPKRIPAPPSDLDRRTLSDRIPSLEDLKLKRNVQLQRGGEAQARSRLKIFLAEIENYETARDQLAASGTSRLSADLKFGLLSVCDVYRHVEKSQPSPSRERFIAQLLWREFAYACLWERPQLLQAPFKAGFADFPWTTDQVLWSAWAEGRTGYPIVDASARQLLREGYVENRARMISASFLTKHLLVDYKWGEAHYLKYLTDGDWAINNMGWQWSAGCGVDAQPYFRVFNPMTQGKKFDQNGSYVRRYLPELARLPDKYIHQPWSAPSQLLEACGVTLGKNYPLPIVDHNSARKRFLDVAYSHLQSANLRST